ncbi:MlaD family protein [Gordonia caeni]|uniref:MCE family protein n=1 Tax=Gordonia caeni TaxID=1007097 RepID=A0ABP7NLA8_9ACTN
MRTLSGAIKRLLLVLAVVILALYTIVQAINRPVGGDVETYHAQFDDVFGLRENGDVRVRGVQVGKVTDIELQPSGTALVRFTVRTDDRLIETDQLAIRFQNLVGQRYLAILKPGEQARDDRDDESASAAPAALIDPGEMIPAAKTRGSFDITRLFNGLRPVLQGADPEVFNTFAENLIHLLQGEDGVGLGDVLADVERLSQFAADKSEMIRVIIGNLGVISEQLQGKASIIKALIDNMEMLFDTLEVNLELLKGAFGEGARVFPPLVESMQSVFDLSLGGHDHVRQRLMELVPDTDALAEAMSVVPTFLTALNTRLAQFDSGGKCTKGEVPLPPMGEVLLGGKKVTLCKA